MTMSVFSSLTGRRVFYRNVGVAFAFSLLSGCARPGGDGAVETGTQPGSGHSGSSPRSAGAPSGDAAAAIHDGKLPPGYRDWRVISVAHEEGNLNSLGAILGNDVAIKAYREGTLPFPDGTIIAALHWRHAPSEENNEVFGRSQSFVAGPATNVQFMVKDSKKYAATGGWGFAHFDGGKPAGEVMLRTCYACHKAIENRDLVFTRYSP
jgi:hypothetical protein